MFEVSGSRGPVGIGTLKVAAEVLLNLDKPLHQTSSQVGLPVLARGSRAWNSSCSVMLACSQ